MDPKILQAMQAIARAMQATHPQQAQEIMQWLQGGGVGALSGATLAMALPFGPSVGIPAVALLAGIRHATGMNAGGDVGTRAIGGGPGTGAGAVGANAMPDNAPPTGAPATGPGTIGYRGLVTGPSAAGVVGPSVFDNNQPGGAPGPAGGPPPVRTVGPNYPPAATGGPSATNGANPFEGTPGMSATAGTGAGQAQQAAAQAAASVATAMAGNRGGNGGSTTPPPAGGNDNNPGGFSSAQGNQLATDQGDLLLQFALKAAGFNPDVLTPATKAAMKALQPLVQARRAAYGAGDSGQNTGGLPQDIAAFAKEFTTPGANFYGHAQQYAQGLLGGKSFQDFIAGLADPTEQFNMYQALTPLLYGGANPMIQQSIADQLQKQQRDYNYQDFQNQGQGNGSILDFIRNQPNLSPGLRSIFGPQR